MLRLASHRDVGRVVWLVSVMFLVGPGACNATKECTLIGCGPTASAVVPLTAAPPPNSKVRACHNGTCVDGNVSGGAGDQPLFVAFPGASVSSFVRLDLTPAELHVMWNLLSGGSDGDRFSVQVTGPDSVPLGQFSGTATFTTTMPNGPDCPPACRTAVLTAS